nr:NADH dehydrogenase subunit 5, mitochondrial [Tanacetum cinerariifolium]
GEVDEENTEQKTQVTHAVDDEGFFGGVVVARVFVPEANEQVRAQPHAFPADEEDDEVGAHHQNQHAEHEEIEEAKELAHYGEVFQKASLGQFGAYTVGVCTFITLLLFVGAMGKSAQLPLYTWLPDAMAGPTPVSALIHAATMVTAGIYLVLRANVLFTLAPHTLEVVGIVGLATALFAATIGLAQND